MGRWCPMVKLFEQHLPYAQIGQARKNEKKVVPKEQSRWLWCELCGSRKHKQQQQSAKIEKVGPTKYKWFPQPAEPR